MSLTEISVRVAIVAMLALVALVAIGWRRTPPDYPRRVSGRQAPSSSPRFEGDVAAVSSMRDPSTSDHRVGRVATRKTLDVLGLGSIAVFIGIIFALVVSTAIAVLVTTLLDRL